MDKVIHHSIKLRCNSEKAFEMFTNNENLEKWLAEVADVEPEFEGKFELFWDKEDLDNDNTKGCKILAIEKNKLLVFQWKGATKIKNFDFMNNNPLTTVFVAFFEEDEDETEIHLIHSGWREGKEWEEARIWFDKVWKRALNVLDEIII